MSARPTARAKHPRQLGDDRRWIADVLQCPLAPAPVHTSGDDREVVGVGHGKGGPGMGPTPIRLDQHGAVVVDPDRERPVGRSGGARDVVPRAAADVDRPPASRKSERAGHRSLEQLERLDASSLVEIARAPPRLRVLDWHPQTVPGRSMNVNVQWPTPVRDPVVLEASLPCHWSGDTPCRPDGCGSRAGSGNARLSPGTKALVERWSHDQAWDRYRYPLTTTFHRHWGHP